MRRIRAFVWWLVLVALLVIVFMAIVNDKLPIPANPIRPGYQPALSEMNARLCYVQQLEFQASNETKCDILNAKVLDLHCEDGKIDHESLDELLGELRTADYPFDKRITPNEWLVLRELAKKSLTGLNHGEYDRLIYVLYRAFP